MSETLPEPQLTEEPQPTEAPQSNTEEPALFDAPADADADTATGYAVYDRTLGRFISGVTKDKPSKAEVGKVTDEGHTTKVVRV